METALDTSPEAADNPGDSQLIKNGQNAETSGCDPTPEAAPPAGGSRLSSTRTGSWGANGIYFVGSGTCYGLCYIPVIEVIDL